MIRTLAIRNLAVIEAATIDFEQSFNVLTGETGAGKSILVEAIGLLLGGRASQDLVRTGTPSATIAATFDRAGQGVSVRREIQASGRSRAFIGDEAATSGALKSLADELVELHGQHEHQRLLSAEEHLPLLDEWAGLVATREQVRSAHHDLLRIRQRLDRLRLDERERTARLDLINFQLQELTKADLRFGEDELLEVSRSRLRHADTIGRLAAHSYADLYESDESVMSVLARVWKRVEELSVLDPQFAVHLDRRDSVRAELEDLALALRDAGEPAGDAPLRLEQVEERLAVLERVKRKYGPSLDEAIARRDALAAEHAALSGGEGSREEVTEHLTTAQARYLDRAQSLSTARHAAAGRFARALEAELHTLAMERARVELRLVTLTSEAHWSEHGTDAGELYFSANPGEDLRPLARIVSGGELSRVMLALKTLAAADRPGKTLVFDEVDAGIGGQVATVVGEKLRGLGAQFQVLCITHLPQIAAAASSHYLIEKSVKQKRTVTTVRRLTEPERIEELARLISGDSAQESARATARELLGRARDFRLSPRRRT